MSSEGDVLLAGKEFLGCASLTAETFKNQFGVYPRTVLFMEHFVPKQRQLLLRSLWWLKTYPTDVEVSCKRISAADFRKKRIQLLNRLNDAVPELPWELRNKFNALPKCLSDQLSFILDTTTIKTYMPTMGHGDWDVFGKKFFNFHKKAFGVKLEVGVAMQRRPLPIFGSVAPAGMHDLTIARRPGDIFSRMRGGKERGLGDPGYIGEAQKIYAPPRRGMRTYDAQYDKTELTLQRRVEMANRFVKNFKVLGTVYRKGAVHAYPDLVLFCSVVLKLVFWDIVLNQDRMGDVHASGPVPDPVPGLGVQRNVASLLPKRPRRPTKQSSFVQRQRTFARLGLQLRPKPKARVKSRKVLFNRSKKIMKRRPQ